MHKVCFSFWRSDCFWVLVDRFLEVLERFAGLPDRNLQLPIVFWEFSIDLPGYPIVFGVPDRFVMLPDRILELPIDFGSSRSICQAARSKFCGSRSFFGSSRAICRAARSKFAAPDRFSRELDRNFAVPDRFLAVLERFPRGLRDFSSPTRLSYRLQKQGAANMPTPPI
jgi:hypothetical protein